MQVDHHIAVNYLQKHPIFKLYFWWKDLWSNLWGELLYGGNWEKNSGVNSRYNLIPACKKCNRLKSDRGGIWILRGIIGGFIWKLINFINKILTFLFKPPFGPIILLAAIALLLYMTPLGEMLMSNFT